MEEMKKYFYQKIGKNRWEHSLRVLNTSLEINKKYLLEEEKIIKASLLHDCAKFPEKALLLKKAQSFGIILDEIKLNNTELIHAPLGAKIAKEEFKIQDEDILKAIEFHTSGRANMGLLEKIIFIADFIEPERNYRGINKVREMAYRNLDEAILLAIDLTIEFLLSKGKLIALETIEARNQLILKI